MNFFQAQDRARRNTLLLVLLLLLGVAGIILMVYVAVFYTLAFLLRGDTGCPLPFAFCWDEKLLLDITLGVIAVLTLGTFYKLIELSRGGGRHIAESLGGELLPHNTDDARGRQLLNVVEEVAIAAGAPVPDVYLMPDMRVNALAAGSTPHNAVIGVTLGALRYLSREELQGVIAHEYSHIMNGDMRLNLRMVCVIHGIMLIGYVGDELRYSAGLSTGFAAPRDEGHAAVLFMFGGWMLTIIGAVGTLTGSLIRAAVSRQREFLADAAAVQYTRNPRGIAGALDKIRRQQQSLTYNVHMAEYSHMFFSNALSTGLVNLFATHPPLERRIERILPGWPADEPISREPPLSETVAAAASAAAPAAGEPASPLAGAGAAVAAGVVAAAAARQGKAAVADEVVEQVGTITPLSLQCAHELIAQVPPVLMRASEEPYAACALIYTLLLDEEQAAVRAAQLQHLDAHADAGVAALTNGLWPEVMDLPLALRLPLVQTALPALHLLSPAQYVRFKENIAALIAANNAVSIYEWGMQAVVVHHLQAYFGKTSRTARAKGDKMAAMEYALSILAQAAQGGGAGRAFAAAVRQEKLPLAYIESPFQPGRLFDAMQYLAALPPKKQEPFARAAVLCASHNGRIDADEEILLRVYFMMMGCPLPLFAHNDE